MNDVGKVIIMSGVSGSGKSTYAHDLGDKYVNEEKCEEYDVVSADDFFRKDGSYKFDPSKLAEAHSDCFRRFLAAIDVSVPLVFVDNTSTEAWEISPYMLAGSELYSCEIITLMPTLAQLKLCHARNTHNVPLAVIETQYYKLKNRKLPPHWKNTIVEVKL